MSGNASTGSTGKSGDIIAAAYDPEEEGKADFFNAFWNEWTHQTFNFDLAKSFMPGSIYPMPLEGVEALCLGHDELLQTVDVVDPQLLNPLSANASCHSIILH